MLHEDRVFGRDRWPNPSVMWYVENGYRAVELHGNYRVTCWLADGTVEKQLSRSVHGGEVKKAPWLWNITDQTTPSMPAWMKDDEKWQRALDAQD